MRAVRGAPLVAALFCFTTDAAGDPVAPVTTLIIRNVGEHTARVQVALGVTEPCDSSDNEMVFDAKVAPGETRMVPVGGVIACARHTSSWGDIDFVPSRWIYGGFVCLRHSTCYPNPRVPMRYDFIAE
jgi:hypothetical protein